MATKKKSGLGKGLDALISPSTKVAPAVTPEKQKEKIVEKIIIKNGETTLKIDEIEPNKQQPRQSFDDETLQELAESIKTHGIIQPLIVQKQENYYQIIAGERRWRAARIAGLKELPVIIKEYTPQEAMEIALIENIQRQDLNPIEEAMAYQRLIDDFSLTQEETAEKVSKSRTAITNSMRLLKLDNRVKQMIIDEMISSGHGRALLSISDHEKQYQLALKIFDNKLSVRETERLVKSIITEKKTQSNNNEQLETLYRQIEERVKSIIGTKVSIHTKNHKKGKLEIEYYSVEDLERIISLIESIK